MTTPLPTAPNSVTRISTFNADTDLFLAALVQYQTELDAYQATLSPMGKNLLVNPAFLVTQRVGGAANDDTYMQDSWYSLAQTASITWSQSADPENGFRYAMRLTQSQAVAQRMGFAQIIEGVNCKHLRGSSAVFVPRCRISTSTNLRYAILGWAGTEDVVTSDVVNNWTSTTYTPSNFFISTVTVIQSGVFAATANTFANLTAITGACGSAFNNLIVVVWTDTAQAQNVTLDVDYAQLEAGATATSFERRPYAIEFVNCQRYFQVRTFGAVEQLMIGSALSTTQVTGKVFDFTPMRGVPTVAITAGGFVGWNSGQSGNVALNTAFVLAASAQNAVQLTNGTAIGAVFSGGQAALITSNGSPTTVTLSSEL